MNDKYRAHVCQDAAREAAFFDRFAENQEYDVFLPDGYARLIKHFKKLINRPFTTDSRVLDLGCGAGAFIRRFSSGSAAACFGVDISFSAIQRARQKQDGIHYLLADMASLSFKEESFDVVIFSGTLHHFLDLKTPLHQACRILKKGGCLVSFDPNRHNPFMWLYRHPHSPLYSSSGKTDNEQLLSIGQLRAALEGGGFVNIRVQAVSGIPFKYVASRVVRTFLPFYNALDYLLGISPWEKTIGSFVTAYAEKC